MRLKTITLKHFRCFESLTLELHPRLTVIVGENGAGKTALLDGIASGLTRVLAYLSSANQRLTGRGIKDTDFRLQAFDGPQGKTQWGVADYAQIMTETWGGLRWDYWRPSGSGTNVKPAQTWGETALKEHLETITASYKTTEHALTPVFAYYGASRGHIEVPERLRSTKHNYDYPTAALLDCFNPRSDFREMLAWFDLEESSELRDNKGVTGDDYTPLASLEAVRATVESILGNAYRNPHFNAKHKFILERTSDGAELLVNQLSQGYQSMLALAMDFARRLALANRYRDEPADPSADFIADGLKWLEPWDPAHVQGPFLTQPFLSAPAIMLVDEIDLHLHPSWQQRVLNDLMRAFPLTQFIVTTHSPQVLSTIRRENIRVLNGDSAEIPPASTYGQPSGDVMHSVMLVDPQPPIAEKQTIDRLTALVDQGQWAQAEAQELLQQLIQTLGPENARLRQLLRSIERQKMLQGFNTP